jgi:human immunodeficiency virus type I enhancer-binding protein
VFLFLVFVDDPGGIKDDIKNSFGKNSSATISVANRTIVENLRDYKDQLVTPAAATNITQSTVTSTSTSHDSKYLHKKFKKFCATVDSNQTHSHIIATSSSSRDGLLNNNSERVENKNSSWQSASAENINEESSLRNNHFLSVPSSPPPKHLQTTEEEKQLVKDIIDINNENFVLQNTNQLNSQSVSNFLITPQVPTGNQIVTVTTLGNHNSNFDHHKVGSFSQTPNGNFVIINNQSTAESQPAPNTVPAPTTSTPGRYICPYCQLNCAKPSVLQKHIRAHTNERPFPCTLCGFAFKTKSNLYKHCR